MQRTHDKYGVDSFRAEVVLACDECDTLYYEQIAIETIKPEFNSSKVAGKVVLDEAARKRLSEKLKLAWSDPARRRKQSEMLKGRKPTIDYGFASTEEHRAKLRSVHRARLASYEYEGRFWSVKDLAEHYGVNYQLLKDRLHAGWPVEKALTTPKKAWGQDPVKAKQRALEMRREYRLRNREKINAQKKALRDAKIAKAKDLGLTCDGRTRDARVAA
jgi:hypothetical protein